MNAFNAEIVKQTAEPNAQVGEATQRAVAAKLDAANLRATIEEKDQELRELREHARDASRQRTVIDRRWREHVNALLVEVRKFAKIYGVDEALDGKIEQAEDESSIDYLTEFLGCLAVMEHPSMLYPRPAERTVRVAEAMARAELGRPGGTVTVAVREALAAAAALQRSDDAVALERASEQPVWQVGDEAWVWTISPYHVPQLVAALITMIKNNGATLVVEWSAKGPEGSMTQSMEISADAGRDKIQPRITRSSTS